MVMEPRSPVVMVESTRPRLLVVLVNSTLEVEYISCYCVDYNTDTSVDGSECTYKSRDELMVLGWMNV
jgi:hypothetical protein